jgi:hypothetical protein
MIPLKFFFFRINNIKLWDLNVNHDVFVLALIKNSERFIFIYDLESTDVLLDSLQESSCDQHSHLNGFDVAILAGKMREQVGGKLMGAPVKR